jgi:hypothetical protein
MPGQAAQQGHPAIQGGSRPPAGPSIQESRASSRSVIGVGVAGALLTAAAIVGVVMMTGSASAPVTTRVAGVSTPSAVVQPSAIAPAMVPAPVGPAQAIAPATNFAPALPPVAAPATVGNIAQSFASVLGPAQAPQPSVSDQCQVEQPQQLAVQIYASNRGEVGNIVRFSVGSYVSPPIVVTRSPQIVTFPAPAGSRGSAQMMTEQRYPQGFTLDGIDGTDSEFGPASADHMRAVVNLRWTTPRC